jgi:hypothetical protein
MAREALMVAAEENPLMECYFCQRTIPLGEPYLSVDYHIERTDGAGIIEVERADSLLLACIDCAPSRSAIAAALLAAGYPVAPDPDNAEPG